jgi:hypothetical protein
MANIFACVEKFDITFIAIISFALIADGLRGSGQ